jgi:hypothetical protein
MVFASQKKRDGCIFFASIKQKFCDSYIKCDSREQLTNEPHNMQLNKNLFFFGNLFHKKDKYLTENK